jgi:hypothetical protein
MSEKKPSGTKQEQPNPTTQPFLPEIMISICGEGDLINARFKIDEKMKRPGPIYIQDEATGKICNVAVTPKIGPLMSSRKKLGNYAFCIFNNIDNVIKVGSPITLVLGEFRKEHIIPVI